MMRVDTRRQKTYTTIYALIINREESVQEFLDHINKHIENNDNVVMELEYGDRLVFKKISYETDEEYNNRIEWETKKIDEFNEILERERYQQYLKLKEIYEPKS